MNIPHDKLTAILAAMDAALLVAHDKPSRERDNVFLDLAWYCGVLQSYVKPTPIKEGATQ